MNDRHNGIFLGVFLGWFAAIVGLLAVEWMDWRLKGVLALWLTAVLAAFVVLQDPPRQSAIASYLRNPRYGTWYAAIVTPVAGWPRDWRCYDWALRIAVVYPILSMVLLWAVAGLPGSIGKAEILPAHESWGSRFGTISAIAIAAIAPFSEKWAATNPKNALRGVSGLLPSALLLVAFAVTGLGAGVVVGAVVVAIAFALAVAIADAHAATVTFTGLVPIAGAFAVGVAVVDAVAGTDTDAVAIAVVGAVAVAFTITGPLALAAMVGRGRGALAYVLFTCALVLVLISMLALAPWAEVADAPRSAFLFLGLLPLVNAITDYASYVVTMFLIDRGRRTKGWAILMALADIAAALVFFLILGAALVTVVAGANALAGVPLYPLGPLFADLHARPENYLWLYLMLFSTLLPTLLHLAIAGFSLLALPFFALVRVPLADWIKAPDTVTACATPVILGTAATASLLLPVVLVCGLYLAASTFWPDLAGTYLGLLEALAESLGAVGVASSP